MLRCNFDAYAAALPGSALKRQWLAALMVENEALVQRCASDFLARTRYHTDSLRDDIFQAARIGLMTAITRWDPTRAKFSPFAWGWIRHEMQSAMRYATPVTRPKSADLPRRKQDEAARFYATHGREPTSAELGVAPCAAARAEKAAARFVPVREAEQEPTDVPDVEGDTDRARDAALLTGWLGKQTAKDRREFWTGKRADLTARATKYIKAKKAARR